MEKSNPIILGVHSGHDASACLFIGSKLVCAIAKERLTRIKHDSGEPIECIEYLLEARNLSYNEIDIVIRANWHNSSELIDEYYSRFSNVQIVYQHHLLHAYATLLEMKENPTLVLISDGHGCRPEDNGEPFHRENRLKYETESLYLYDGIQLKTLEKFYQEHQPKKYPWGSHINSVGYAYDAVGIIIFKHKNAAGKVMALASLGKYNENIPIPFIYADGDTAKVNEKWLLFLTENMNKITSWECALAQDLAFSIQYSLEQYFSRRLEWLSHKYGVDSFLLGGGVALNCKNNGIIANNPAIRTVGMYNACGDDSLSIGAAVFGLLQFKKHLPAALSYTNDLGRSYAKQAKPCYKVVADDIVQALIEQSIIGVFTKGSEFGPRALGYRSIIALANNISIKDRLNRNIKQRELFRPFGGSILAKNVTKLTLEKLANDNMLSAAHISPSLQSEVEGLIHLDSTIRLHIVHDESSLLGRVLSELERKTGQFVVLNTSFNQKNEPIVESPIQAMTSAQILGIDYLVIENQMVKIGKI